MIAKAHKVINMDFHDVTLIIPGTFLSIPSGNSHLWTIDEGPKNHAWLTICNVSDMIKFSDNLYILPLEPLRKLFFANVHPTKIFNITTKDAEMVIAEPRV